MFKITNLRKVEKSLKALNNAVKEISDSRGKDIAQEVKKNISDNSVPISPEERGGDIPQAIYESVYQGEIKPTDYNMANSDLARDIADDDEKVENEIVDRFIRDFFNNLFKDV